MKLNYKSSGVNYEKLDFVKKLAQQAAVKTGSNLSLHQMNEIKDSRGESAYVWKQGNTLMATVIEGLGTKNLVADEMRTKNGKTYYDAIANDTIAAIINDLISVGASPLVIHAYWAIGDSSWLLDKKRINDLIKGWQNACNLSGASWGGGETPTYKGIINNQTIDLGGSAVGIIKNKKFLITDKKIKSGDRIILLKSSGINMNGLSLARAISKKLPNGFKTLLPSGKKYGEALLAKTHIYAKLIQDLQKNNIDIHYLSHITGHGLCKIMRARHNFTYILNKVYPPHELFSFIQKHSKLSDYEMYKTFNMGQDYAIYLPAKDVIKTLRIIKKNGFTGLDAGYVKAGERQVIIEPKNIVFKGDSLDLR